MSREQAEQLAELMQEQRPTRPAGVLTARCSSTVRTCGSSPSGATARRSTGYLASGAVPRGTELMRKVGVEPEDARRRRARPRLASRAISRSGGRVARGDSGQRETSARGRAGTRQPRRCVLGVCGRRWERPTLRWAVREFEEHDCPAGEAARSRRAVKAAEREVACEACGWSPSPRSTEAGLFLQSTGRSARTQPTLPGRLLPDAASAGSAARRRAAAPGRPSPSGSPFGASSEGTPRTPAASASVGSRRSATRSGAYAAAIAPSGSSPAREAARAISRSAAMSSPSQKNAS